MVRKLCTSSTSTSSIVIDQLLLTNCHNAMYNPLFPQLSRDRLQRLPGLHRLHSRSNRPQEAQGHWVLTRGRCGSHRPLGAGRLQRKSGEAHTHGPYVPYEVLRAAVRHDKIPWNLPYSK